MGKRIHRITNVDPAEMTGDCATCGRVAVKSRKGKYWACKTAARFEYLWWSGKTGSGDRYRFSKKLKKAASKKQCIEYAGGRCVFCGYSRCYRGLHFHHVDPKIKDFAISRSLKSWESIKPEIEKCILVCANCHSEIHGGVISQGEILEKFLMADAPNGKAPGC